MCWEHQKMLEHEVRWQHARGSQGCSRESGQTHTTQRIKTKHLSEKSCLTLFDLVDSTWFGFSWLRHACCLRSSRYFPGMRGCGRRKQCFVHLCPLDLEPHFCFCKRTYFNACPFHDSKNLKDPRRVFGPPGIQYVPRRMWIEQLRSWLPGTNCDHWQDPCYVAMGWNGVSLRLDGQ